MRMQAKRHQNIGELKRSVGRDLERLLNTKREAIFDLPEGYREVRRSVLTYGLPDFSTVTFASRIERTRVVRMVEQAIAMHEPRLRQVRVAMEDFELQQRALRFRIDAMLHVDPAREFVSFDAALKMNTGLYEVVGRD